MDLSDYHPAPETAAASTLPARWYLQPEFLELEKEKIFRKTWQLFGRTDQVQKPGDFFTGELAGEPLVVLRDSDGKLRAYSNVCRHRASLVAKGQGNCKALVCPYHGWTYSLNGSLLGAREFDGAKDWHKDDVALPEVLVEAWGPYVFVNLDPRAEGLASYLGKIPFEIAEQGFDLAAYRLVERREYEIQCNWKVYVDNYQEGYHIPTAHPALFKELDYSSYRVDCFPNYSFHYAPIRKLPQTDVRVKDRRYVSEKQAQALYYWIFPNLMINIYPDNMSSNLILPLSAEKTLTVFEWFYTDEWIARGPEWIQSSLNFGEQVQQEDIALCESVHKGLRSQTYDQGRFSPGRENGVHHFHQLVHRHLAR